MSTTEEITDYREQMLRNLAKLEREGDDLADAPKEVDKDSPAVEEKK